MEGDLQMSHPAYLINEDRWDDADPYRSMDNEILSREGRVVTEVLINLQCQVKDLEAKLALAGEDRFWLVAEIARLNAKLGQTTYQTVKTP
jgi:hypothetical protein